MIKEDKQGFFQWISPHPPQKKKKRKRKVISPLSTSAAIINIFHRKQNKNK